MRKLIFNTLLQEVPKSNWFCCDNCNNIYVALQDLVSKRSQKIPTSWLSAVNRKHIEKGLFSDDAIEDVQWRIFRKADTAIYNPLLSITTSIFRVSFFLLFLVCFSQFVILICMNFTNFFYLNWKF